MAKSKTTSKAAKKTTAKGTTSRTASTRKPRRTKASVEPRLLAEKIHKLYVGAKLPATKEGFISAIENAIKEK